MSSPGSPPMNRPLLCLALLSAAVILVRPTPAQVAEKPPYERILPPKEAARLRMLQVASDAAQLADNYEEAIKHGEEMLALRTEWQGADHWETVEYKWQLDQLRTVARLMTADRAAWRESWQAELQARALLTQGAYAKAVPLYRERLARCEKVLGAEHPETAGVVNDLARNLQSSGRPDEAQPLYQRALDIWRKTLGETHPTTGDGYGNVGLNLDELGRTQEALPLHQLNLKIKLQALGEDDEQTVVALNNLGLNLERQARYTEAEALYRRALSISRRQHKGPDKSIARGCLNLANCLSEQGKTAEALPLAQEAVSVSRLVFSASHPRTATSLNTLGIVFRDQGRFAEAEAAHRSALEIRRRVLGNNHPHTATSLNHLADAIIHRDDASAAQSLNKEAEPLIREALEIWRRVYGDHHPTTALGYESLAGNLSTQGKSTEALKLYRAASDIYRETVGEEHPSYARSLHNIGSTLSREGTLLEAEEHLSAALKLWQRSLGEFNAETIKTYVSLASNLSQQGRLAEAEEFAVAGSRAYEGLRIRLANSGLQRASFAARQFTYPKLAAIRAERGDSVGAWTAAEADLARGLLDSVATNGGESFTAAERKTQAEIVDRLNGIEPQILRLTSLPERTEPQQTELARLQTQRRDGERELASIAVGASQRSLLSLPQVQAAIPEEAAIVLWVDLGGGDVQDHWGCVVRRTGEPHWERLPGTGPGGKWRMEDSTLPKDAGMALVYSKQSLAEVEPIRQTLRAQRFTPLLPHLRGVQTLYVIRAGYVGGFPIETIAPEFTISYIPSGSWLAGLSKSKLPAGNRLLALGDPLFGSAVPEPRFRAALPPGGVLITKVAEGGLAAQAQLQADDVILRYGKVEIASAEQLAQQIAAQANAQEIAVTIWRQGSEKSFLRTVPPGKLGVSVAGSPARELLSSRQADAILVAGRGGEWPELPGTRVEVEGIARLFGTAATSLLDSNASAESLQDLRERGELEKYRYLHFATHGEMDDQRAFDSSLILAPGTSHAAARLTANEVIEHWHLNAELVTLSACESALGSMGGGDGVLGFEQAFLSAGSRSVCLSLWRVDDIATALLMQRFYRNLLGKNDRDSKPLGKARALAEAKTWLRNLSPDEARQLTAEMTKGVARGKGQPALPVIEVPKSAAAADDAKPFSHPKYWAAFVLIGDPN